MSMSPLLIQLLTFLTAALAVLGVGSLVFDLFIRRRLVVAERLNEEFKTGGVTASAALFKDLKQLSADAHQQAPGRWRKFQQLVEQSGLGISAERLIYIAIAAGWLFGSLGFLFGLNLWFGLVGFGIGFALPLVWAPWLRHRRVELLRRQLPDAFDLMARAVQAGQTITSSLQVVTDNFDGLLAREFRYLHEQQQMGLPTQLALNDLVRRTGVVEMRMFAVTLSVQRQSGGNPVEMLNNLADVIRKRSRLLERVRALTGEGRMQALVLLLMPLLLFAVQYVFNREYVAELFEHQWVLLASGASMLCGVFFIHKIVNFDY